MHKQGKEARGDLEGCSLIRNFPDPGVLVSLSYGPFLWLAGGLCGTPVES